jgi:hypothetical protein
MPSAGFEPAIPVSERPQTHALDRTAIGIGPCTVIIGRYCDNYMRPLSTLWAKRIGAQHFQDIVTEVYSGAVWCSLICDVRASVECATVCHQQLADVTNGCPCSICDPQHWTVRWYAYASRRSCALSFKRCHNPNPLHAHYEP